MPPTLEERVFESLLRAADYLLRAEVEVLREEGLTFPQYNVLRILRGAGGDGLACGAIGSRLIRHDPDITRLVDRLERRGLVARARDAADRRVVRTQVTPAGLELLARLDEPVDRIHERQLGHMSQTRLRQLRELVGEARGDRV